MYYAKCSQAKKEPSLNFVLFVQDLVDSGNTEFVLSECPGIYNNSSNSQTAAVLALRPVIASLDHSIYFTGLTVKVRALSYTLYDATRIYDTTRHDTTLDDTTFYDTTHDTARRHDTTLYDTTHDTTRHVFTTRLFTATKRHDTKISSIVDSHRFSLT